MRAVKVATLVCIFVQLLSIDAWRYEKIEHRIGGEDHPCYRPCVAGVTQTCVYDFTVTEYLSMSAKCGNCPYNSTDCLAPGCITAGGSIRPVSIINNQLPGTSIQVCLGDTVVINMLNSLPMEGTTIHWHGLHQINSPHMDGVPYVTQCPVHPNNVFQYKFVADSPGTHMWHSHLGYEEADGMFGKFTVRRPLADEPNANLYDYDLPEHTAIVWHWFHGATKDALTTAYYRNSRAYGEGIIVNGKGSIKKFISGAQEYTTPREIFNVSQGSRYRFRIIYNTGLACAVQVSVDGHKLLVISSESGSVEPIEVDSIMLNGGERFDFVLNADQPIGNYWVRFRGAGMCNMGDAKVHQEAVLHYNGADGETPTGAEPTYEEANAPGKILNPTEVAFTDYSNNTVIRLTDINNNEVNPVNVSGTPDSVIYIKFSVNRYANLDFPGPYFQVNDITFAAPPFPLLSQRDQITSDMYCTDKTRALHCDGNFCTCSYLFEVKLGSLVEIVFVDVSQGSGFDHPYHLHGYDFQVVAMDNVKGNISVDIVKQMNEDGLIKKKLVGAPIKDTLSVPAQGYAVIRFVADNPGYWMFHCHISEHAHMGMGAVLKVGEHSDMAPNPRNFPTCGDWSLPTK